jgi:hypothetical protein
MLRMCVYMYSRLVENHPIQILEDGPLTSEVVLSQCCKGSGTRRKKARGLWWGKRKIAWPKRKSWPGDRVCCRGPAALGSAR